MKKYLIFNIFLLLSSNAVSETKYFFDYYGYIKEYNNAAKPSFNNQLKEEKLSRFYPIYDSFKNKAVSTIASSSIGKIEETLSIKNKNIFQCSLLFDNIIRYFNKKLFKYSQETSSYFVDVDHLTNFSFTTCPIKKYNFLKENIQTFDKNIFFINSHPSSLSILNKLIFGGFLSEYHIYIKNYHFYDYEDLNLKYPFLNKNNTTLFIKEEEIIKKITNKKLELDAFDSKIFYESYKNFFIKHNSRNSSLIKESDIKKSFFIKINSK